MRHVVVETGRRWAYNAVATVPNEDLSLQLYIHKPC